MIGIMTAVDLPQVFDQMIDLAIYVTQSGPHLVERLDDFIKIVFG